MSSIKNDTQRFFWLLNQLKHTFYLYVHHLINMKICKLEKNENF